MYTNNVTQLYTRGMIVWADLGMADGSRQAGLRPIVIIQNNIGNKFSPVVIVAAITSKINKKKLPTHVELNRVTYSGLSSDSLILAEQLITLDKKRLGGVIGYLNNEDTLKLNNALKTSLQLDKMDKVNNEVEAKIHSIVKNITIIDGFIVRSIKKGIDASIIYDDFSERNCLICELRELCNKHRLDCRDYYNEKTIEMPLVYAYN